MKKYTIFYKLFFPTDNVDSVTVTANNKEEAYDKAVYEAIPQIEKVMPYSAWVQDVTYSNGRVQTFNTFEGKPV